MKNDMKNMNIGKMMIKGDQSPKTVAVKSAETIKKMAAGSAPLPPGDTNADMGHEKLSMSKDMFMKAAMNGVKRKSNG